MVFYVGPQAIRDETAQIPSSRYSSGRAQILMCGIVGIVSKGPVEQETLARMRDAISHRGPDDAGLKVWPEQGVGLANRRLSIIDLSKQGHQPMANEDGSIWITFNGEIYNFKQLRTQLEELGHRFSSTSDTEVVIHTYEEWGESGVERLRGMFAYAIWDSREHRLLLVRDRLGIKPIYYYFDGHRLAFASELKAILADQTIPRKLDHDALLDYLTYGYVPFDRCIFQNMHKLPAAHMLTYKEGRLSVREYWEVNPDQSLSSPREAAGVIRECVADAVSSHMVADVPVGVFLSGGVDSSAVTGWMTRLSRDPVRSISINFDEGESEAAYARLAAKKFGTEHRERTISLGDAQAALRKLAWVYDEPFYDASAVPTLYLAEAARSEVKVALSGDGGDEVFAGYTWHKRSAQLSQFKLPGQQWVRSIVQKVRGLPFGARSAVLLKYFTDDDVIRHFRLIGIYDDWELARLLGAKGRKIHRGRDYLWLFKKFFRSDLPLLTALQLVDLKTYLPDDILVKVDRASMAASLEVRPPLLDHLLVEQAFRLAPELQINSGETKWIFREAMRDMLPVAIYGRRKKGFSPPMTAWFKRGLWNLARDELLNGCCVQEGIIEPSFVEWMVNNVTERRWAKVWSLLMLEFWYRRWVARLDEDPVRA